MYVTFLLDLAGDGENRAIRDTVRLEPDPRQRPKNAFHWKIVCDVTNHVIIRGHERTGYGVIAAAHWRDGKLAGHAQRDTVPTDYQWKLVELALAAELGRIDPTTPQDLSWIDDADVDDLVPHVVRDAQIDNHVATKPSPFGFVGPKFRDRKWVPYALFFGGFLVLFGGVALVLVLVTREQPPSATQRETSHARPSPFVAAPTPLPIDAAIPPTLEQRVEAAPDFATALELARPSMNESGVVDGMPEGGRVLAHYASKLRWADVDGVAQTTTIGHALKDPELERGKKLCASGVVDRIERRDVDGRRVYVGQLTTADGDAVAFVAAGTTGDIVKRSKGTICGAVIGKLGDAVSVIGMFDLPENRNPIVESER